jgi:DNA integrity scanning protein DisA with diadenylate cyclase activity
MDDFIKNCVHAYEKYNPTLVYIISDSEDLIRNLRDKVEDSRITILTSNRELDRKMRDDPVIVKREKFLPRDILILASLRHYLLRDCFTRALTDKDRVLCIVHTDIKGNFFFDVGAIEFVKLKEKVEDYVDLDLLEHVIDIALDIASEGREGNHVGALFIVGDSDNVMKNCRDQIVNPFQGHSPETRNLHNHECWETVKQFGQLDGAVIVDDNGVALAAGKYVNMEWGIYLESGFGGRHTAAATISKKTRAIAVVVSETGNIRIFQNGKNIFALKGR